MAGFKQYRCQKFGVNSDEACGGSGARLLILRAGMEAVVSRLEPRSQRKLLVQTRKACRLSGQGNESDKEVLQTIAAVVTPEIRVHAKQTWPALKAGLELPHR
jgi:hypothetical protein